MAALLPSPTYSFKSWYSFPEADAAWVSWPVAWSSWGIILTITCNLITIFRSLWGKLRLRGLTQVILLILQHWLWPSWHCATLFSCLKPLCLTQPQVMVPWLSSTHTVGIETLERLKNAPRLSLGTRKWHSPCLDPVSSASEALCPLQFRLRPGICLSDLVTPQLEATSSLRQKMLSAASSLSSEQLTLLNEGRAGGLQHLSPLSAPTPIDWLSPWGRRCPVLWCDGWTWGS